MKELSPFRVIALFGRKIRKYQFIRAASSNLGLAPSASSHLSLGTHDVGHEGVATGRRDLSLPTFAKADFRIGSKA